VVNRVITQQSSVLPRVTPWESKPAVPTRKRVEYDFVDIIRLGTLSG
jgi:hypothetical protein